MMKILMKRTIIVTATAFCMMLSLNAARVKCKFPEPCGEYAEDGENFCSEHKCASFGCHKQVALCARPKWAETGFSGKFAPKQRDKSVAEKPSKWHSRFCSAHQCIRKCPQNKLDRKAWSFLDSATDSEAVSFLYCDKERLASCKYCIDHACRVATCSSPRMEAWKKVSDERPVGTTGRRFEVDGAIWSIDRFATCRGHSGKDPSLIPEREGKTAETAGDRVRARLEASEKSDAKDGN